jgi:hypothetical protein
MLTRPLIGAVAILALGVASVGACAAVDEGGSVLVGSSGGDEKVNVGAVDGSKSDDSNNNNNGDDGPIDLGDNGGQQEVCQAVEVAADPVPLDMYVVLDRSGSMSSNGYWTPSVNALKNFFNDPASAGINVGMNFFPKVGTSGTAECHASNYSAVQVTDATGGLVPIPANAATLDASLNATSPGGTTPLYGALEGTYVAASTNVLSSPDHKTIVVLASDGQPCCSTCVEEDISVIAHLSADAFNNDGIETYAIAIDSSVVASLTNIASAGGTTAAIDISANINDFAQKMADIRDAALGCDYGIPDDPTGSTFDPQKINVTVTNSVGDQQIPQAIDEADCGANQGWYYDDPTNPTTVHLCPSSCTALQSDAVAEVALAFGCPTELN